MTKQLDITPLTRIGELLETYPELENILIGYVPAFKKLRNPILRRTVAKVATVEKAASIAGIDVRELVVRLRRAAGQSVDDTTESDSASVEDEIHRWSQPPPWIDASKVNVSIDADALLEAGEVPISRIVQAARQLSGDQVILVTSTFRPVPLIEALEKQGFRLFLRQAEPNRFETFVCRLSGQSQAGNDDWPGP